MRRPLVLTLSVVSLLPGLTGMLAAPVHAQGHLWEFNIKPMVQVVDLPAAPRRPSLGLAVHVGVQLPARVLMPVRITPFFDFSADATIGASNDEDVAFSTGEFGMQLMPRRAVLGVIPVGRVARSLISTAETRAGDVLANYSGAGWSWAAGVRWRLTRSIENEFTITYLTGTFDNRQLENITTGFHTDEEAVSVGYGVWRVGFGFAF